MYRSALIVVLTVCIANAQNIVYESGFNYQMLQVLNPAIETYQSSWLLKQEDGFAPPIPNSSPGINFIVPQGYRVAKVNSNQTLALLVGVSQNYDTVFPGGLLSPSQPAYIYAVKENIDRYISLPRTKYDVLPTKALSLTNNEVPVVGTSINLASNENITFLTNNTGVDYTRFSLSDGSSQHFYRIASNTIFKPISNNFEIISGISQLRLHIDFDWLWYWEQPVSDGVIIVSLAAKQNDRSIECSLSIPVKNPVLEHGYIDCNQVPYNGRSVVYQGSSQFSTTSSPPTNGSLLTDPNGRVMIDLPFGWRGDLFFESIACSSSVQTFVVARPFNDANAENVLDRMLDCWQFEHARTVCNSIIKSSNNERLKARASDLLKNMPAGDIALVFQALFYERTCNQVNAKEIYKRICSRPDSQAKKTASILLSGVDRRHEEDMTRIGCITQGLPPDTCLSPSEIKETVTSSSAGQAYLVAADGLRDKCDLMYIQVLYQRIVADFPDSNIAQVAKQRLLNND